MYRLAAKRTDSLGIRRYCRRAVASHDSSTSDRAYFASPSIDWLPDMHLENVNVVLLEEKSNIRVLVKSILRGIGFGNIFECRDVGRARSLVEVNAPDLLILDLDLNYEAVCKLIRDVRQQRIGKNPFVVAIGMTWNPEPTLIQTALDAGSDDVVKKPISTQILIERVTNLIDNRKEFIAAPDYVGPCRGKGVRTENEEFAQLKVPNSLRQKATGKKEVEIDERMIARAAYVIGVQRLNGLVFEIADNVGQIERRADENGGDIRSDEEIRHISELVARIQELSQVESVQNLTTLVSSLSECMATVDRAAAPTMRQLAMVRLHAEAIAAALRGETARSDDVTSALGEARTIAG